MPALPDHDRWLSEILGTQLGEGKAEGEGDRDEQLLARELLPIDQLQRHARDLAQWHRVDRKRGANELLPRLAQNAQIIERTRDAVTTILAEDDRIPPAGEWLLDNAYLVEEQIRLARRHLPRSYSRELPRLTVGAEADYPRVYALALEFIAHVDGRVDGASLDAFFSAYQESAALNLGELWAVPIVLRLALIENLRRVCVHLLRASGDQAHAAQWAARILAKAEQSPQDLIVVVADMARANLALRPAFVAEFVRRLTGQHPGMGVALSWVESRLSAQSTTSEQQILRERQNQAADQVSISATFSSLRMLDAIDWRTFVEEQSIVERILREDPAKAYPAMDFATRDRYRHAVESLSRRSRHEESAVARAAVEQAAHSTPTATEPTKTARTTQHMPVPPPLRSGRSAHVGWWLIAGGLPTLTRHLGARRQWRQLPSDIILTWPLTLYLGGAMVIALALLAGAASLWPLLTTPWMAAVIGIIGIIALSAPALAIQQRLIAGTVPPRPLPRLDFSKGIPAGQRTIVGVPCLLTNTTDIDRLIAQMEVRQLGNPDPQLGYALLSDWRDAPQAEAATDQELLNHARTAIQTLNRVHARADGNGPFLLLHRPRVHAPSQGVWMGWERKRGKLAHLNRLLLHGDASGFAVIEGDRQLLQHVRSVIVLDADTQLPPGAAAQLVGAIAHPLNRPGLDASGKMVVAGHALIQPRVAVTLPSATASRYASLGAGEAGIDPYTRAISDTYQDLFDEGSFVGKGIYDVAAFEAVLHATFPENRILSHDLIEGCHLRSGLDSETFLLEDYPARYLADSARRHRWTRGDWQIVRWLLPRPPTQVGHQKNRLSALSRWKILDNVRRPVAAICWLIAIVACAVIPGATFSALFLVAAWFLPVVIHFGLSLFSGPGTAPVGAWLGVVCRGSRDGLLERLLTLAWLPHEVTWTLDAMVNTWWRLLRGQKLLQWTTAADAERSAAKTLGGVVRRLWMGPALAVLVVVGAIFFHADPTAAIVLGVLWAASGVLAWQVSRTDISTGTVLTPKRRLALRQLARQTYAYFEDFCGEADHFLPPDNVHLSDMRLARRTSPTNIGLKLLADMGARDLGHCGIQALLERLSATVASMGRIERYRGHFLNWYDTSTLESLTPRYVSTVDSGNLVGHLLVLRQGLLALGDQPVWHPDIGQGLHETWLLVEDALRSIDVQVAADVRQRLAQMTTHIADNNQIPAVEILHRLSADAQALVAAGTGDFGQGWPRRFAAQVQTIAADMAALQPWVGMTDISPAIASRLEAARTLHAIAALRQSLLPELTAGPLSTAVAAAAAAADALLERSTTLAHRVGELSEADFAFLLDPQRKLFVIGFHVSDHRADQSCYDLLASEARLASYIAVAQHQVDHEHWFRLGRLITNAGNGRALVSWSGSMFEYLMPALVMPTPDHTLLGETCRAVIARQIAYGRGRGVPWGVSESGYHRTDQHLTYQYRAFGIPGLGLKRGLADDLVIAPYASLMALPFAADAVWDNVQRLLAEGAGCVYGLVEAIDYTPSRLPRGQDRAIVQQVMVHHQGMSYLALVQVLANAPMQTRFLADAELRAMELLLHERPPALIELAEPHANEAAAATAPLVADAVPLRIIRDPKQRDEITLLSNGRYHVMLGAGGGGWSRWEKLAVTRWRDDATTEDHGCFIYLRDQVSGERWSAAYQPLAERCRAPVEAIFTQAKAEYRRLVADIDCHTEIAVSPEDDVEVRRLTLRNQSPRERIIEITTYAEVVIAAQAADEAHPAFSNLFVQTEVIPARAALLATRRPRTAAERPPFMIHQATVHGATSDVSWTTARVKFIGRGRSLADPICLEQRGPLDKTTGAVIDPALALRHLIRIPAEGRVVIDITLGIAATREGAETLAGKYAEQRFCDRVFELAWTHAQVGLRQLGTDERAAQDFARLAGAIVHPTPGRRAPASLLVRNRKGQSGLWAFGISGDVPIVLVRMDSMEALELVTSAVQAHAWWRSKGLITDLVILVDDHSVYRQALVDAVTGIVSAGPESSLIDRPGGVFIRRGDQMGDEDRIMFQAWARVILSGHDGSFTDQIERRARLGERIPRLELRRQPPATIEAPLARRDDLVFRNTWGGFTRDGREYVLVLKAGEAPPQPWVNVIANPNFGAVVTERGGGYTWLENSHEFRLTPWYNDPVTDRSGEAFYLRDEMNGRVWSPTPGPAGRNGNYVVRHGFGYSAFEHFEDRLASELWTFVAIDAPVRFWSLTLRNHGTEPRRISITAFVEWVLGEFRGKNAPHLVTGRDQRSGALTARNPHHPEFGERIAFLDCSERERSCTADRNEFIGSGGRVDQPAGLRNARLSNRSGAGLDPCAAMSTTIDLAPGQERQVTFMLGVGAHAEDVQLLIQRFRGNSNARRALEQVWAHWNHVLGSVHVETPEPAVDHLVNGWLVYQVLSCRVWARSGFYQSGGAYGFRDQLQDVMSLVHAAPATARAQIVRASARQFREGDVQHWWHPPANRGVRTRFSDDLLWLPLTIARYVTAVDDRTVLDVEVPFLEGRPVAEDEEAYYDQPAITEDKATIYEHAARAIDLACTRNGPHGLPLIGCGDWNDGMNLVGEHGKGESVWLAFFLWEVIRVYAPFAAARGDSGRVQRWQNHATAIMAAVEREAWDGEWYRRASMDDGRWLGSAQADECRIDSLPQSWAVLTGAADPERTRTAIAAVDEYLVRCDDKLIQLFDPPFDKGSFEPGYIKGYLPGVRENGGQYTHAAIWTVMAFARMGDAGKAWELFDLINPVLHADTPEKAAVYQAEPYVIAADVYGVAPHIGRGGWSWYTGSAGWCYRLLIEDLLGLRREAGHLIITPLLRPEWPSATLHYRHQDRTFYHIVLTRKGPGSEVLRLRLDGIERTDGRIPLADDAQHHRVEVEVG